jgi:hypothetical protein
MVLVLLKMMNLEVVSGCRGVSGDLFWEGSVGCELRILRYHYNVHKCVVNNYMTLKSKKNRMTTYVCT